MAASRVQNNQASAAGNGTTIAVTLNGIVAQRLVASAVMVDNAFTISGVADDLSVAGVATGASRNDANLAERLEHWYFKNHGGGNRTFTATFSGNAPFRLMEVVEVSGADTASPLGPVNNNGSASGTTATAGSVTPANDGSYIFASGQAGGNMTEQSPLSLIYEETTNVVCNHADVAQSTAAAINPTWTVPSGAWSAVVTVFYPAAANGGPSLQYNRKLAIQQRVG